MRSPRRSVLRRLPGLDRRRCGSRAGSPGCRDQSPVCRRAGTGSGHRRQREPRRPVAVATPEADGGAPIRGRTGMTNHLIRRPTRAQAAPGENPDGDDQDERNRPPNRRRRTGGAGGTGKGQQGYHGDSPDDRLDAALEHIREAAESRRLPEELPPEVAGAEGKDW